MILVYNFSLKRTNSSDDNCWDVFYMIPFNIYIRKYSANNLLKMLAVLQMWTWKTGSDNFLLVSQIITIVSKFVYNLSRSFNLFRSAVWLCLLRPDCKLRYYIVLNMVGFQMFLQHLRRS